MAVKVKKATGNEQLVVNQIIIKAPNRNTSDISTWRNANTNADKGKVKAIYDLFEDLMLDGILSNAITKRIDAIKLAELNVSGRQRRGKRANDSIDRFTRIRTVARHHHAGAILGARGRRIQLQLKTVSNLNPYHSSTLSSKISRS